MLYLQINGDYKNIRTKAGGIINNKLFKQKMFLLATTLFIIVCFVSCNNKNDKSSDTSSEAAGTEMSTLSIDISMLTSCEYGEKTQIPEIVETRTVANGRVVLSGTCEQDATIYVLKDNNVILVTESHYGSFIFELSLTRRNSPMNVSVCAKSEGKALSDPVSQQAVFKTDDEGISEWVWVGKDFHLFFSATRNNYFRNDVLNDQDTEIAKNIIQERVKWLDKNLDATPIYILVPNPNEIYGEFMPENIGKSLNILSFHDQTARILSESGAHVIDMKPILKQHKNDEFFLYHNTDSHWTEYASYFAYNELFNYISQKFSASLPRPIEDFGFANESHQVGDLYIDLGMDVTKLYEMSTYSNITFKTPVNIPKYKSDISTLIADEPTKEHIFINSDSDDKPNVVIMRDSYSIMMFDFVAERCANTTMLEMWDFTFHRERLTEFDVDYVIYIICDMNLHRLYK